MVWLGSFLASVVLDCFGVDALRMARAGIVYSGDAFGSLALCRTGVVSGGWVSFLDTGYSTLAS